MTRIEIKCHLASTANASLDLIGDEQNVVLLADFMSLLHEALLGDDHTSLTLDGLHHERADVGVRSKRLLESDEVVVPESIMWQVWTCQWG